MTFVYVFFERFLNFFKTKGIFLVLLHVQCTVHMYVITISGENLRRMM